MSDLPGHDHDPDPAALDELRRAFGDEVTRPTEPNPIVRKHDRDRHDNDSDRDDNDRDDSDRDDSDRDDDDRDEDGDADRTQAASPTPDEPIGSPELAALARNSRPQPDHEPTPPGLSHTGPDTNEPDTNEPDTNVGQDDPDGDTGDQGDGHDDERDDERGDERDDERGEEGRPAFDHDPTPEAESAPVADPPRIIRIDDYGGSVAIDPADPSTPSPSASPSSSSSSAAAASSSSTSAGAVPTDEPGEAGIISISVDDDLPDPVYVEGNLDRDGGGTIVFIENDETGDTLAPDSERDMRRGIEPRMRERRVAVKRAQGRRRLKRVLLIVGVVVVIVGGLAVLGSPLFAVREGDVEITGAVYSRGEAFDAVVDDAVGTPVLRVDTTRIEDDLEAIPWIEQAQVTTQFPHGLTIDVRERAAVSTYQGPDGRFRVLDRDGRVLDVIEDGYPYAYVLIGGPDPVDLEPGEFAPQGYAAASELAKNLTSSVRGKVVRIDVTSDGSRLSIELDDGSTVFFGEARDILAKLVRLEAVLANGEEREPGLIDVSTSDVTR